METPIMVQVRELLQKISFNEGIIKKFNNLSCPSERIVSRIAQEDIEECRIKIAELTKSSD